MAFVNISNSNMSNHLILFICIINILFVVMSYMECKQMILLVMNSEYAGEFKTNIKKFVGYQYILDYVGSEGEGQTIIKEFD